MEARKITVVSTKNQTKKVIMSTAETLRELKNDFDNAGIDYTDMTFYEGTAKVELIHDDAFLPKDVPYTNRTTGETKITNDLVFMLTNTNKKIKSGAMTREYIYQYIKTRGLQDEIKKLYGRNYTQVPSMDLERYIHGNNEISMPAGNHLAAVNHTEGLLEIILELVDKLQKEGFIDKIALINELQKEDIQCPYSEAELDDMFNNLID